MSEPETVYFFSDAHLGTDATECEFDSVSLKSGPGRLMASVDHHGKSLPVKFVEVLRLK